MWAASPPLYLHDASRPRCNSIRLGLEDCNRLRADLTNLPATLSFMSMDNTTGSTKFPPLESCYANMDHGRHQTPSVTPRSRDLDHDDSSDDMTVPYPLSVAEEPHMMEGSPSRRRTKISHCRYPDLIMQPPSSPISKDQLAAEVKSIYAGLVMVEARCINIDAAQASGPNSILSPEKTRALIALHRTLLYDHHAFLMATQHPSTKMSHALCTKYHVPAKMWKHGIHSFLGLLRTRRPDSQEYMLAFIYLAYQMMALLYETVPEFTDTWTECLGDLARYRMAIEEDKEQHSIWGGVAGRWYNTASDRSPKTGRLYHHLGVLERPTIKKFYLYTKSLGCLQHFPNANNSLTILCDPILDTVNYYVKDCSAEAHILASPAQIYSHYDDAKSTRRRLHVLKGQADLGCGKAKSVMQPAIRDIGVLLELGSSELWLWRRFAMAGFDFWKKLCTDLFIFLASFASTTTSPPEPYEPILQQNPSFQNRQGTRMPRKKGRNCADLIQSIFHLLLLIKSRTLCTPPRQRAWYALGILAILPTASAMDLENQLSCMPGRWWSVALAAVAALIPTLLALFRWIHIYPWLLSISGSLMFGSALWFSLLSETARASKEGYWGCLLWLLSLGCFILTCLANRTIGMIHLLVTCTITFATLGVLRIGQGAALNAFLPLASTCSILAVVKLSESFKEAGARMRRVIHAWTQDH